MTRTKKNNSVVKFKKIFYGFFLQIFLILEILIPKNSSN